MVAKAAVQHGVSGRFLLERPTEELEEFLRSRCSALESVQRKRVMYEIDRRARRAGNADANWLATRESRARPPQTAKNA